MRLKAPFDRITVEPEKMGGQPCIRGLRITVRRVVELLAEYESRQDLLRDYPDLEPGDLTQALQYAASNLDGSIEFHIHAA
jgi:uncharacterized protein (DUF433 family)